ncbi:MAG: RluA family pseudouridine synthase [Gemmataceae bacterium]
MTPKERGPLLPYLLTALAPKKRTGVKQLLTHGQIHVNGVSVTRHDFPVKPGDQIAIVRTAVERRKPILPILFEDDHLIAIDKPEGLLTVATETEKLETAFVLLTTMLPHRPFVVHRLDRETSGVLLFAKSNAVKEQMQANWDRAEKTYLAIVEGKPSPAEGTIENFLHEEKNLSVKASRFESADSKKAISRYRTLKTGKLCSLVEVIIETGRKHQIRVHMAGLGCPIVADNRYGARHRIATRLCLHAHRLAFDHPVTGQRAVVESPLPGEMKRIV